MTMTTTTCMPDSSSVAQRPHPASPRTATPRGCIIQLLRELATVIEGLNDEQYNHRLSAFGGCIGGHVRHSLDHVRSLLDAVESGRLDYDHRQRGTRIESDRWAALDAIRTLIAGLLDASTDSFDRQLAICSILSAENDAVELTTTLNRELVYVLSHTVHHNAMIAAMTRTMGGWTPRRFGYAPSTLVHQRETPCVR